MSRKEGTGAGSPPNLSAPSFLLEAKLANAEAVLLRISLLTDSEMQDGDGARLIALQYLSKAEAQ